MLAGGFGTCAVTLIAYATFQNADFNSRILLYQRMLLTVAVAVASIFAGHCLVIANQVIDKFKK